MPIARRDQEIKLQRINFGIVPQFADDREEDKFAGHKQTATFVDRQGGSNFLCYLAANTNTSNIFKVFVEELCVFSKTVKTQIGNFL